MAVEMSDTDQQIAQVVKQNVRLTRRMYSLFACSMLAIILSASMLYMDGRKRIQADKDGVVHLSGVAIIDASGKTRVRLQAPLPEPIIMGTHQKRDDSVSGVMLYDALGNERGGYVTDNSVGNAFLTLDSNTGQEVTLVASSNGGAEFGLNDDQKNKVVLQALQAGPRLRLVRAGTLVFEALPTQNSR